MRKPDAVFSVHDLATRLFQQWRLPPVSLLKVAYSGGLDSHVLLHALAAVRAQMPIRLGAVHIDHGLHPQSAAWTDHCARVCRELAVPMQSKRVAVTTTAEDGLEAAARRARYAAFATMLAPGEYLVTAQHRDDQAETVLLQLLRGAGVAGLAAMPDRTKFGGGELLRPLLDYSRRSLEEYARRNGLAWIDDPSNQDLRLRRNYLRAEILPRLAQSWPETPRMLARTAEHMAEADVLLSEIAEADRVRCERPGVSAHRNALSVTELRKLTPPRQRNLVRHWLHQQHYAMPRIQQLEEILRCIAGDSRSGHSCVCWEGVEVWRYRDALVAVPARALPDPQLDVAWNTDEPILVPGVGKLGIEPVSVLGLAYRRLPQTGLRIRLRRGGETVNLPGRDHHHAVKKLLQAAGIPPWERARLPMFYADTELVAVADRWVSAEYAAQPGEPGFAIVWQPFADPEKSS